MSRCSFQLQGKTYYIRQEIEDDADLFSEFCALIYDDKKTETKHNKALLNLFKAVDSKTDAQEIAKAATDFINVFSGIISEHTLDEDEVAEDELGEMHWRETEVEGDGSGYSFRDIRTA